MMHLWKVILPFVFVTTTILQYVSTSTISWLTLASNTDYTIGLWRRCITNNLARLPNQSEVVSMEVCQDLDNISGAVNDELRAARAFIILSHLVGFASMVLLVLLYVNHKKINEKRRHIIIVLSLVLLLQAVLQSIGVGAATKYLRDEEDKLHAALPFAIGYSLSMAAAVAALYFALSMFSLYVLTGNYT